MGKERIRKRKSVLLYIAEINGGDMRRLVWVVLILAAISFLGGCARATRIANDIDWIVFDGEPIEEN